MPRGEQLATIKDIAQMAGISIGTVDRILHNRGRFSQETAERVRQIVDKLDYKPNVMARHLSQSKTCSLGVLLPHPEQDSGYWVLPRRGIERAHAELAPFNLELHVMSFDRYRPGSMMQAGTELLGEGINGLLTAPLIESEARGLIDSMPDIPVAFIDTDLPDAERLCYIGQDSYRSGKLAARLMENFAAQASGRRDRPGRNRTYLVVSPDTRNEHLENRIQGFREHIRGETILVYTGIELDHDRVAFLGELERRFRPPPDGVFVVDASAHHLAKSLDRFLNGLRYRPILIGYDLVPENRTWMERGVIDVLLTQRPAAQGYRGVQNLARSVLLDEPCPARVFTPIDIVIRENLEYMNEEERL